MPLLASSIILFYLGIAFAYFVVFPLMFNFFTAVAPEGVEVQTDISQFLDFITTIVFAFGIAFEVPIATVLITWTGLTTPEKLGKARPYVFLAAFVVGMFLTPPDIISQTLLAIPVYLLYELGILMSRLFSIRGKDTGQEAQPGA
jgi:sec-independent protein translocase protein TatC